MFTELQRRNQTRFFHMIDRNRDGKLTWEDHELIITRLAAATKIPPSSPEFGALRGAIERNWNELKQHADLDKDDAVSLEEWISHHERMVGIPGGYEIAIHAISDSLLGIADDDRDGKLTLANYIMLLDVYGVNADHAKQAFQNIDTDKDGIVSKDELLAAVSQFVQSSNPNDPGHWLIGPPSA
jgi:Ca2+-binding EF-hand superfamily protein